MTSSIDKCRGIGSLALLFLSAWLAGCGSEERSAPPVDDVVLVSATGEFRKGEGTLAISVSPKDDAGNFVGHDLPESAFTFENVTISSLRSSSLTSEVETHVAGVEVKKSDPEARLDGVLIFDSSGSMATNDPGATGRRRGGEALLDVLRERDRLAVLDFGAGSTPPLSVSRVLQDFTDDTTLLRAALNALVERGGTPLYRSIVEGLGLLEKRESELRTLVVLTDGQAEDKAVFPQVVAKAQDLSVPIYAIGLGASLDFSLLTQLATETGGGFIEASDADALERAFAGVSSGVSLGAVMVRGRGRYELPAGAGRYRVAGDLVTTDGEGERIVTPFALTLDVQ